MYIPLFLFLIFYNVLERFVPMMSYWDELAAFLALCWGAYDFRRNPKMGKQEQLNWILLAALVVIGALGNLFHPGLQDSTVAIVKDVVALCKFPVIFFVLQRKAFSPEQQKQTLTTVAKISRWILILTLFALMIGRFVDLGFYTDDIRILPSCTFLFSNPTFFISSYVMIAAVLIAESVNKNRVFLLLDCLLIFLAQRSKGYIFIAFLVIFILLGEKWITRILNLFFGSDQEKVKPLRLILAAAVLLLMILTVGRSRIEDTLNLTFPVPRIVLHVVGFKILMDFFPLGSGLGTFASHLSGKYYSNVYDMYGISNVIGMNREKFNFISDVFWPYIYGQFGIFGLLLYGKIILDLFFRQFRSGIADSSRIAMAAVWIYALIATTAEAYFTNTTGVQMALFLTMFIGYGNLNQKIISE